jgi:hypothetical protein
MASELYSPAPLGALLALTVTLSSVSQPELAIPAPTSASLPETVEFVSVCVVTPPGVMGTPRNTPAPWRAAFPKTVEFAT